MTNGPERATNPQHDTATIRRGAVPQQSDSIQDTGVVIATRNHVHIREWATRYSAEPATGEATTTGQATVDVNDGGACIRFNFPAAGLFRPISWDEWFEFFERDHLVFVYEPASAPHDGGTFGRRGGSYYRLLPASEWSGTLD